MAAELQLMARLACGVIAFGEVAAPVLDRPQAMAVFVSDSLTSRAHSDQVDRPGDDHPTRAASEIGAPMRRSVSH